MKKKTDSVEKNSFFDKKIDRREMLKSTALLGGSLAASGILWKALESGLSEDAFASGAGEEAYAHYRPENQIYTVCQQCNTNCGVKVKIVDGMVAKIDGNPYNPWTLTPHINYKTPASETGTIEGSICPKGQAGIQTLYDPYRIVKVLKRKGKRGDNKWETISFDKAVDEIANGGDLFGEGHVEGLKDICTLKDPLISAALAEDTANITSGKMTVDQFKIKHKDNLQFLIDPDHPDMGPKNNQFCLNWGRVKGGRGDLLKRFTSDALGSVNAHGHTTVCQGSLYFTCKAMSDQFNEGKWSGGSKFYWQADTGNSEFIIFVGSNPFEANYGPPLRAQKITEGTVDGRMKIAVIDPRCSKTASKAWKWIPVRPNGVGAFAMGMIQWMLENGRYDSRYLTNANKGAAKADNEPTWTQAVWLVKIGKDGKPGTFLRGSDIGLGKQRRAGKDGKSWEFDSFITSSGGKLIAFDPNDDGKAVEGDLFVDTEVSGIKVKSVLQIYRETALAKTPDEWAKAAGTTAEEIAELSKEFTSHGKKAAIDMHRGVSQHTSGFYNVLAWMIVNILIGNHDWQGGLVKATTYNIAGGKEGMPFDSGSMKGKIKRWGIPIIRSEVRYEKSTLFEGYPAKRVWYPFATDIYQEVIPSLGDMYPYQIKALFLYMGSPVYSLPSGHTLIDILRDTKKLPLFFTSDIVVGETSMYADYIFPDLTYLERWEFSGSHPSVSPKVGPVRQPASSPLTDTVTAFGEKMPISMESLLLGLAEKLSLPGFGDNAMGPGLHLKREEDYYLRMVANIAAGEKPDGSDRVPAADGEEIRIFKEARRHLPETVFNAERWESVVGPDLWPHVVYVLNRGGRFQGYKDAYSKGQLSNKYGKLVGIYFDNLVNAKNSMTGLPYLGYADYIEGPRDTLGRLITDEISGFDMTLITYKHIAHTKSRTISNYWTEAIHPENAVEISVTDGIRLGLKNGDRVRVVSATNEAGKWELGSGKSIEMIGRVKLIQGIRPGVAAFSLGHGHWAYGSSKIYIDKKSVDIDKRRSGGIHANAAMRTDTHITNTTLTDVVGGSAVFYQSQVKLIKV
jgi:anaerobic selenocysteine-containing dehydrogenase